MSPRRRLLLLPLAKATAGTPAGPVPARTAPPHHRRELAPAPASRPLPIAQAPLDPPAVPAATRRTSPATDGSSR
jgi:hypothetical protein